LANGSPQLIENARAGLCCLAAATKADLIKAGMLSALVEVCGAATAEACLAVLKQSCATLDGSGALECGRAVQVDPIKPVLKAPVTMRLILNYGTLLSRFAFKSNLRRYNVVQLLPRFVKWMILPELLLMPSNRRLIGGAVQVDPMKPKMKPPGTMRLKLKCDILLSTSDFNFNLRRYRLGHATT